MFSTYSPLGDEMLQRAPHPNILCSEKFCLSFLKLTNPVALKGPAPPQKVQLCLRSPGQNGNPRIPAVTRITVNILWTSPVRPSSVCMFSRPFQVKFISPVGTGGSPGKYKSPEH